MTKENGVKQLTDMVADFVAHIGKKLPDDVVAKLEELGSQETAALPKVLYETMTKNQELAVELEPSKLSGYRCSSVLAEMWNKFPVYQRTGRTFERCSCTGNICSTIKT